MHSPTSITAQSAARTPPRASRTPRRTREELDEQRRRATASSSPVKHLKPSKHKPAVVLQPAHDEHKEEQKERDEDVLTAVVHAAAPAVLPVTFRSDSVRSWRDEKRAQYEAAARGQGNVESDAGDTDEFSGGQSAAAGWDDCHPSADELLFHLDRCQRNVFID